MHRIDSHTRGRPRQAHAGEYRGPIDYDTPCGVLITKHHGRLPIVLTAS